MQEYVSDFIGKPILTRSGECVGYVKNVQTDKKLSRLRNLECCDNDEEEFLIPLSALASFGQDAVVVKSLAAAPCKDCISAPFGMSVYSAEGTLLGQADDFLREGKQISALLLSDETLIPVSHLSAVTDTAIVDPNSKKRTASRSSSPKNTGTPRKKSNKATQSEKDAEPKSLPYEEAKEDSFIVIAAKKAESSASREIAATAATAAPVDQSPALSEEYAANLRAGRGLLTGKILPRDLKDARGNILARAGSVVSAQIIRKAMEHDKLFELTLLCCGNAKLWEQFR